MKNVLLFVHDDAGQEARFQAALDVVRAVEGHLTCLDVAIPPVLAGDYYVGDKTAVVLQAELERESANRARIEERLARDVVPWNWVEMMGDPSPCIEDAAGLADLIVVNRKLDKFPVPDMIEIAGEVVLRSGKPLLAVPEKATGIHVQGTALVAWDGSAESSAALSAAVPLLRLAEQVRLLEVGDGSVNAPAEEAAAYLSRHGIKPSIERVAAKRGEAGEAILEAAGYGAADYVVMGAFGHSRTREWIFGGATRCMLCHSPVPVLLAH